MSYSELEYLKQRYHYYEWQNRNTLGENLFVWKFYLNGNELPEWQPYQIENKEYSPPKHPLAFAKTAETRRPQPSLIQSTWTGPSGFTQALLNIDIFECGSKQEAHETLVRLLGEFQLPVVTQGRDSQIGDVMFAEKNSQVVMFARGNIVQVIRNAGSTKFSVNGIARRFDQEFIRKPEAVLAPMMVSDVAPRIGALAAPEGIVRVGETIPLLYEKPETFDLEDHFPEATESPLPFFNLSKRAQKTAATRKKIRRSPWYKCFSSLSGEIEREGNRVVYRPISAGEQQVEVYAIHSDQTANAQRIRIEAT